jgi:outer membrane protein assembly factor BamB
VSVDWLGPAESDGRLVVADRRGNAHLLVRREQPQPHLTAQVSRDLEVSLDRNLAALGKSVFAIARPAGVGNDRLLVLSASDLQPTVTHECQGSVVWGPAAVGAAVLLATDNGQLAAFDAEGSLAWQVATPGTVAGAPLPLEETLIFATLEGQLFRLARDSGQLLPWQTGQPVWDLQQPLGAAPALFMDRFLVLLGRDSTLHVVRLPSAMTAAARETPPASRRKMRPRSSSRNRP